MKKFAVVILAAGVLLGTAGCSPQKETERLTHEVTVTLQDGRVMPCIMFGTSNGSLDCDWGSAK